VGLLSALQVLAGSYDKGKIQSLIQAYVKEHPVLVFAQTTCPYCQKAKDLLSQLGAAYKVSHSIALSGNTAPWERLSNQDMTGPDSD
jgi:thiol-disulfide isomerase/thioredoxin